MKPRHVYRPPRKNRFLSTFIIVMGGVLITFMIFYLIPLMQQLEQGFKKEEQELVAEIQVEPEEEYVPPEEQEEPEEEPEPEPEFQEDNDDVAVEALDLPDLGAGSGGKVLLKLTPSVVLQGQGIDAGGGIDTDPTPSSTVDPQVPRSVGKVLSKRGAVKVVVGGLVDEKGSVVETSIVQSSGIAQLDQLASKAFKRWKFKPAIRNGRKAKARVSQPFTFRAGR